MTKYVIKSKENGKYLSSLTHSERFRAIKPEKRKVYFYDTKQIAEDVANQENGVVVKWTP